MKQVRIPRCSVVVAFLLVMSLTPALGQNRNAGEIRGTITDPTGARVPGARVTIRNTSTGVTTQVIADTTGGYDAPSLEPGEYSIEFSERGFTTLVRNGITLHVEAITVNARLEVGSANQRVTVTAGVPLVQTETSDRRATITAQTINALPNVGRSWFDLTGQ
ncbi:MAG: carboxypeptidase-like regulatory domain-containing protein, partial [Candidatus Dormibacteraceae bacterium]